MNRHVPRFWGSAIAAAAAFAVLAALLLPLDALRLATAAERERAWLLTLWTGGVLGILFGLSALLGTFGGVGVREVLEAGSVRHAMDRYRQAHARWGGGAFHASFGWWLVTVGALLIAGYFAAWSLLKS